MTRAAFRKSRSNPNSKPETSDGLPERDQPAWLVLVSVVLTALCLVGLFATEIGDTDFWWHLKTGQFLVQHHALPVPDPFAFTTALNPSAYAGEDQVRHFNLTHEWLAQALLYCVYVVGGLPSIILARALLLAGFCGWAGLLAARRSGNFYFGIAAAFAAASLAIHFTADRPALFTFFMVAAFVAILEYGRFLWMLLPLALLWANCHGGFVLGWVVVLAYCAGTVRLRSRSPATADGLRLWLVAAGVIAVSGLNPNGFAVVSTLLRYRQSSMTANLIEWSPPYLWGPPYAFDILLYSTAAVLFISWRRVRISDWALFAAFGTASLLAFRNIPLIGFLAPVLIASYFPVRLRVPRITAWLLPILLAGVVAFGAARGSIFQLRAAMWKFPVGAADYLLQNHISGPLFNTWEDGGYLIWRLWPQQRVFIDGRSLSESANRDYRQVLYNIGSQIDQVAGPRAELLHRYGIQAVVTNTFEYVSGAAYPLAMALAEPASAEWQLVYDDAHSLVFLRDPPRGTPVFTNKMQRVLDHMDTECSDYITHDPELPGCARTLADYWLRSGDRGRAYRMLSLYLTHAGHRDPEAEKALQRLINTAR